MHSPVTLLSSLIIYAHSFVSCGACTGRRRSALAPFDLIRGERFSFVQSLNLLSRSVETRAHVRASDAHRKKPLKIKTIRGNGESISRRLSHIIRLASRSITLSKSDSLSTADTAVSNCRASLLPHLRNRIDSFEDFLTHTTLNLFIYRNQAVFRAARSVGEEGCRCQGNL